MCIGFILLGPFWLLDSTLQHFSCSRAYSKARKIMLIWVTRLFMCLLSINCSRRLYELGYYIPNNRSRLPYSTAIIL